MAAARLHLLSFIFLFCFLATADPIADKQSLLDFIRLSPPVRPLNWLPTTPVCGFWTGVTCSPDGSRVTVLRLPGIGFGGPIPPNTLSRLSALQILSLRSNALTGAFPSDLLSLPSLTGLHLQLNSFSGALPDNISNLTLLATLDLSFNNFTGPIPASLNNLTHLAALNLSNNSLSGAVPDLQIPSLQLLNLSNNHLTGVIPPSLLRFPNSSFSGNNLAPPTPIPLPPLPSPSPSLRRKLSESAILGIVIGGCAVLFIVIAILMLLCYSRGEGESVLSSGKVVKGGGSPEKAVAGSQDGNRLVFFEGCNFGFDLEDLLRASAEVLGKGTVGTSYKAVLEEGTTVVVKRLKEVAATKREFEQQMEALGRVEVQDNPNILPLRAYYYSKDEKLLVFDYLAAGSLSALLHGSRGSGRTPLDWESRMRVALAAGRGLAHLHSSARLVHGNLKASNVLLRDNPDSAALSDYGLVPLFVSLPRNSRTAGYRAPEVVETRKPTYKSDVYSLGVLLLELLTGKAPNQASIAGEEGIDLPRWVQSVVREEWTAEVFDVELMRYPNIEEEMVQLLQIAMACVSVMPESRPEASVVVRMMEDIVRRAEQPDEGLPGSSDEPSKGGTPPAATP